MLYTKIIFNILKIPLKIILNIIENSHLSSKADFMEE